MEHGTLKGGLTISRPRGNIETEYIQIEVNDHLSNARFISIRVPLASFAEALTGLGHVDCEFDLRAEHVGMRCENKDEMVPCADLYATGSRRAEIAKQAFAPFEVDGWKGRVDDLFNPHRRSQNGARVTFTRYVKVAE